MPVILFAAVRPAGADVELPQPSLHSPITIAADQASHWRQGSYDVWLLRGNCYLNQGLTYARSSEAVLWIERRELGDEEPTKIIAYLEDQVAIDYQAPSGHGTPPSHPVGRLADKNWFGRFYTRSSIEMRVPAPAAEPTVKPAVFERGMARFDPNRGAIRRAQFTEFGPGPAMTDPLPLGTRRLRAFPRSNVPVQAQWFPSADGREVVAVINSGVNLIIDGLDQVGALDIATDRIVIWTSGIQPDLSGQSFQRDDMPLEIYMEGNIVFRQGDRVIYAQRMYYDVSRRIGIVLDAELLTPLPGYAGFVRLKAAAIRQLDESQFVAHDALITTSRMGEPRYYLQSETITFQDTQQPVIDPLTGAPVLDPETGQPAIAHDRLAQSSDNFLYVGGVPIFYWPTMATDLERPVYYVESFSVGNDDVFGTQVQLDLNAYQLLGIANPPEGTEWEVGLDLFSKRGLGFGTEFRYDRSDVFGIPGPAQGFLDAWAIDDDGLDNLGRDRRALVPEKDFRGRVLGVHRQRFDNNFTLTGEVGLISDRNFLEQYYEAEWDERKDQTTGVELKQMFDNQSWSITADARINDFFTQTEWLPRADHFWLGQPLLADRLTWFEHSNVGYARMQTATTPTDPADAAKFALMPWEADLEGERFVTRQEIDLPLSLGPVKFVPYALGELAHWGEDLTGDDLQRAYFQTGARASLPMWSANPAIENHLLNVHGLAHKVVFDGEFSYSDANRDLTDLPLYDPLDDDSVEAFRRRFFFDTFGMSLPTRFDPRFYALRSGMGGYVTSPVTEIADDLMAVRLGIEQRWQTKRGPADAQRIIDWVVFDAGAVWFPKEDRDNFGEEIGLANYDFRWHVGDRLTLVSDGEFDFFSDGLRVVTVGGFLNRPPRGNIYLGFRSLEGPISANVLAMSLNYWMSPKWVTELGASIDFSDAGNIGQHFALTRVGESALVRLGFNVDESKGSVGVNFMIEPRFLPKSRLARTAGIDIPPAGAFGLE